MATGTSVASDPMNGIHDHRPPSTELPPARGYQQEMLAESLKRNIVIAMDTGSGKTHIAVLRMKFEAERESRKLSWFIAPTVALCEQQHEVIKTALPVPVGLITGALAPDQWKDAKLWAGVLEKHRVMVSSPQVLLDAMRHGYINMGRDINLLIFDEAHHAADKHPYNLVMKEFYFELPQRGTKERIDPMTGTVLERPMILGLTASPSFGGDIEQSFRKIEENMDASIRAPLLFRQELSQHVHRPRFTHVVYPMPPLEYYSSSPSPSVRALEAVVATLDIEDDPYVKSLRKKLAELPPGPARTRADQKLSKAVSKTDTYTHKGLKDFSRTANEICYDLGPWPAEWYIRAVISQAKCAGNPFSAILPKWGDKEKEYMLGILNNIALAPFSEDPAAIEEGISEKVRKFMECLESEKAFAEDGNEAFSGIVFVTRRDSCVALTEVLSLHPRTKDHFQVGTLLGSSENAKRRSFIDITRSILKQTPAETLRDFRIGEKNLVVATAVAEEGLDIQACGSVIRWDPPQNMVSWAQSRGRARKQRSSFVLMFDDSGAQAQNVTRWQNMEKEMMQLYYDAQRRDREMGWDGEEVQVDESDDHYQHFWVESTGAVLTTNSAIGHLHHLCSVLPGGKNVPFYDIDPEEMPEGWHLPGRREQFLNYTGPFGCTVTLPRQFPANLRVFSVDRIYRTKTSARRNAAFKAYITLYEHGLLNDRLLPLMSLLEPEKTAEVKALLADIEKRHGTTAVTDQIDPWLGDSLPEETWYCTTMHVTEFASCRILTRVSPLLGVDATCTLYPGDRPPVVVTFHGTHLLRVTPEQIDEARNYTRRLFWTMHHRRMQWGETDFAYLITPPEGSDDSVWNARRASTPPDDTIDGHLWVNAADWFSKNPDAGDLFLLEERNRAKTSHLFLAWRITGLSTEEIETFRSRDPRAYDDVLIESPSIVTQPLPRRANLLVPTTSNTPHDPLTFIPARYATAALVSEQDALYARMAPSIFRYLAMAMTTGLLADTPSLSNALSDIPLPLLRQAITAPVAEEGKLQNYQRLESLGDTVLKYMVSLVLLAEYPLWHEGYLSRKKDHAVSNVRLAKGAISAELYKYMIRDRFSPRKWKPQYISAPPATANVDVLPEKEAKKSQLSTKMLADIVESLIGAAYLQGSFSAALKVAQTFDIGIAWRPLPGCVDQVLARAENFPDIPKQIDIVERIIGYSFDKKVLLMEALTHASLQGTEGPVSYERMEFLGDSVIDMIVNDYLYRTWPTYTPHHIHLHKQAVVNLHFLGFLCLEAHTDVSAAMPAPNDSDVIEVVDKTERVYLWQCLLHSSHAILDDQHHAFGKYERTGHAIWRAFEDDLIYPWAALVRLQAPKFLSDIIESVVGAVFLDSQGNMDVARKVLRRLGLLDVLEGLCDREVDVEHPKSRVAIWAAKQKKKVEYVMEKEKGHMVCTIVVDGKKEVRARAQYRGKASQEEVKFTAAEALIKKVNMLEMYGQLDDFADWYGEPDWYGGDFDVEIILDEDHPDMEDGDDADEDDTNSEDEVEG